MVADLGFDVEIVGAPIVREPDGVAMSSRNVNLHPEARHQARVLVAALDAAATAVDAGERDRTEIERRANAEIAKAPLATIDYAELRDPDTLEPAPEIIKTGRNLDAGQDSGSYSDPVYGHEDDDVIWRIEVRNNGLADLQDLKFSDAIAPGNFTISHVCDNEGDATSVATGGGPGGCLAVGGVTEDSSRFQRHAFPR